MPRFLGRFLTGIILGGLIGFSVWAIVSYIGIWKGWPVPTIISVGVGVLISIVTWLVPKPKEVGKYLRAFWGACKMFPEERILYRKLAGLYHEQQEQPHKYIYLMEDEVNVFLSLEQSANTVKASFYIVSCLLDDTPIEACEIMLVYEGYSAPQGVFYHQIKKLHRLTKGNKHSYTIPVNDDRMMRFISQVRDKKMANKFSLEVYLHIEGMRDKVNHEHN